MCCKPCLLTAYMQPNISIFCITFRQTDNDDDWILINGLMKCSWHLCADLESVWSAQSVFSLAFLRFDALCCSVKDCCVSLVKIRPDSYSFCLLSLTFTFRKWRTSLEVFEGGSMKSKLFFFSVWRERRLFSSLCLTSQCFGVSLIEGMLSFTSFLYSISWFPVHTEAHGRSVREATICLTLSPQFKIRCHGKQGSSRLDKLGVSWQISGWKFTSNVMITYIKTHNTSSVLCIEAAVYVFVGVVSATFCRLVGF